MKDIEADQNEQIERHYQDCISGSKKYGDVHEITGIGLFTNATVQGKYIEPSSWVIRMTFMFIKSKYQLERRKAQMD